MSVPIRLIWESMVLGLSELLEEATWYTRP